MESTKKHPRSIVLRPDPEARDVALRIISHLHTVAWGVADLRRSIARALPDDEALAASCEALLDVLADADAEASHAYNHGILGVCPREFQAAPMRNNNPHGTVFRMGGEDGDGPEHPGAPDKRRDDADTLF